MANPEHIWMIRKRAEAFRKWRSDNPEVQLALSGADLRSLKKRWCNLTKAELNDADLRGANLGGSNLCDAGLARARLAGAKLDGADLTGANLQGADLCRADLSRAKLVNANLRAAHLVEAYFGEADLTGADLGKVDLDGASLRGARLVGNNLAGLDLSGVDLCHANLDGADLRGADLRGTDLSHAKLNNATLRNVKIDGSRFHGTQLANTDLTDVMGLDDIVHRGPSKVSFGTVQRSGGLPLWFLTECGMPPDWMEAMRPLINAIGPIHFYSCFISYSSKDEEFCKRLYSRMRDAHLRVWFAPEDIKGGKKIHEQIDEAIRVHDKLLIVLSETSMESEWVATEIYHARQREVREGKRVLFPIRLVDFDMIRQWSRFDADTGKDMAREIREYFIPDFSNWKDHDAFEAAFAKLLDDLKAEADKDAGKGAPNEGVPT